MLHTSGRNSIDLYVFTLACLRIRSLRVKFVVADLVAICIDLSLVLANVAVALVTHLLNFTVNGGIVLWRSMRSLGSSTISRWVRIWGDTDSASTNLADQLLYPRNTRDSDMRWRSTAMKAHDHSIHSRPPLPWPQVPVLAVYVVGYDSVIPRSLHTVS